MKNKNQLKEILEQIRDNENLTQTYIDTFDEFFEKAKQDEINTNVLECIFTNFINLAYRPTKTNKFLINQLALAEKLLIDTFTDEQKRLYEVYDFIQTEYSNDYAHKAFVYAYKLGDSIREETNSSKLGIRNFKKEINKCNIVEVIKLILKKYRKKINGIISGDTLTLEYLYKMPSGEIDVYKSMELREFEEKLSIKFYPERTTRIIEIDELQDIFEILEKQICKVEHTEAETQAIKEKYPVGTKIKLIKMYDLYAPPSGTTGTVTGVDDKGQIHVNWNNHSSLALIVGTDKFEIVNDEKGDN